MKLTGVTGLLQSLTPIIDELFTTPEEQAAAHFKLLEMAHKGQLAQIAVNTEEAKHDSLFVAGWRPATGWICVSALGMYFIIFPLIQTFFTYYTAFTGEAIDLSGLPVLDMVTLLGLLSGLLGLGGYRMTEKIKGVSRSSWNGPKSN